MIGYLGRPKNPLFPYARTKIELALHSSRYKGVKKPIENMLSDFCKEIAEFSGISYGSCKRQIGKIVGNEVDTRISPDIINFCKIKLDFTDEIVETTNRGLAQQLIDGGVCDSETFNDQWSRIKNISNYTKFYSFRDECGRDVELVYGGGQDIDTDNLIPRNYGVQCYLLNFGKKYRFHVTLWERNFYFYLVNREPDGTIFLLSPSNWGVPETGDEEIILPAGAPAPTSSLAGIREIYGIMTCTPLNIMFSTEAEPRQISQRESYVVIEQIEDLLNKSKNFCSIRRFDYIVK